MYGWDILVLLKHLLEEGLDKTAIAERLGVDRKTVGRWIAGGMVDTVGELECPPRVRVGAADEVGPVSRDHSRAPDDVSGALGGAAVR